MNSARRAVFGVAIFAAAFGGLALAAKDKGSKRLSDEERGEVLYNRHCIQCHGADNAGDGPATEALVAPVPDLRGKLDSGNLDENARVVLDGRRTMPGFEPSFDKQDARRVLRYMEKIARMEREASAGAAPQTPPSTDTDVGREEE